MSVPVVDADAGARRLGAGGEAEIFTVPGWSDLAEKRYRRPGPEHDRKLRVMLQHPPEAATRSGPVTLAWPRELVTDGKGRVVGFRMPRLDLKANVPLFQIYNPQSRRRVAPALTWRYLVRTARNLAAVVDELHRAGYIIGDLNESNLLVSRKALVALVDCDSIQVRDPGTGETHRCHVGKADFLAPEFQGRDLSKSDRTRASDDFALAILVFLLLLEGIHPYAGVWRGRGDPPELSARMRARRFPYLPLTRASPPPVALRLRVLPLQVRWLCFRAFVVGAVLPWMRPSASTWRGALDRLERKIHTCARSPHHEFGGRRKRCPWCARIDAGLPDPFPGPTGSSTLTPRAPSALARARGAARSRLSAGWSSLRAARVAEKFAPPAAAALLGAWRPLHAVALVTVAVAARLVARTRPVGAIAAAIRAWFAWSVAVACSAAVGGAFLTVWSGSAATGTQAWGAFVAGALAHGNGNNRSPWASRTSTT